MGQPAAKKGDQVVATDTHVVLIPAAAGAPVPTPLPNPFSGLIDGSLSSNVKIMDMPAAVVDSTATNMPPHIPQGGPFQRPPSNKATIVTGSKTVNINRKPAARNGDIATTCNDPFDLQAGTVVAVGTVNIGD